MLTTPDFEGQELCRDEDSELFFPVGTDGPALAQTAEAKAVCAACPVQNDCLLWAIATGTDDGIFGGYTPRERRALERGKGVAA